MKRCPECRRDYYDETLLYCLDDGSALLEGPAARSGPSGSKRDEFGDESPTAIVPEREAATAAIPASAAKTAPAKNSIAVLPFANISADAENEYFCDGLAEEILNALSRIDDLKVAARTSAFSFKNKNADVSEIGEKLGVRNILEGSVRKSGDRLRITSQLVSAADGYQLWSERYDREMKDVFDVQDEIALSVVEAMKVTLLGEKRAALLKRQTRDPKAYEFYLRGLSFFNKWTPADFHKAIENFEAAIAVDPGYAPAYAGVADAYTELSFFSFSTTDVGPKTREAAARALELDDSLAEAHISTALIKMYFDWDFAGAEDEFKRAIALNSGSASSRMWYGWFLALMARFDESQEELQRARELDPLSAPNINAFGVISHWSRQPERAIAQFREVLELYPNYTITLSFLAEAYAQLNDMASAIATIEQIRPEAMDPQALSIKGYLYARSGDRKKALGILEEFAERSKAETVPAINVAHIHAGLGDHDQALEWLEKACHERSSWIPFMKVDVKFDSLRSSPRFAALLRRVGFAR